MIEKFKIIQGRKSEKDRILLYYDKAVAFENVSRMCLSIKDNNFLTYLKKVLETRRIPKDNKYDEESLPHDIAEMCIFFMRNEDNLYPPSRNFQGAKMFKRYIAKTIVHEKVPCDTEFQIKKNHGVVKVS